MTPVLHAGGGMLIPQVDGDIFIDTFIDVGKLKNFVLSRRAADGGFAFCKPLPSSLPETYYAVFVLRAIDADIPGKEELVEFLTGSIREEPYAIYTIYAIFYTFSCLKLLDEELPDLSGFLLARFEEVLERTAQSVPQSMGCEGTKGTTATYSFSLPNILREVYLITSSLRLLGENIPNAVKGFVEKFRRDEEFGSGYGVNSPNLQDTYYCLYILEDGIENPGDTISFIRRHECPAGGFTKSPGGYPPYLEETYYALSCLKILGFRYSSHERRKIQRYIASLQNSSGGFRRSIYGGISTLEDTYFAIASLVVLKEMAKTENP